MSGHLILYDSARDALAECKSVDEVKGWADRAAAAQAYARMAKDKSLEVDAAEIRIRAERRLGEMLTEQKASGGMSEGGRPKTGRDSRPVSGAPTLAEVGISKDLSARAQKIAAVPEAEFEAEVGEWRERVSAEGARVTAKLEASGQKVIEQRAPSDDDEAPPEDETPDERLADLARDYEAALRIIESDDKLAEAWGEVKALTLRLEDMNRLYSAKCAELATMTKEAKRWMKKAQALERGAA